MFCESADHGVSCTECRKEARCHVCGARVKRAPFSVEGKDRCTSGACLSCCYKAHVHKEA